MGQSKWRKENDPDYGKPKSVKSGLIVSPPIVIEGSRLYARSTNLDPQELRFSLLFWDQLVWPSSRAIHFASGPDEKFLEAAGILSRPDFTVWGDGASGIAAGQIQAFIEHNEREPGAWCLAQGENSLLIQNNQFYDQRGTLLELHRAIPVPDKDVPLAEILEFKQRRSDEFGILKQQIENLYLQSTGSTDSEIALGGVYIQDSQRANFLIQASGWVGGQHGWIGRN
ncbi:MAG: hypothetical protein FD175_1170 [Beijerinckiaceae bacterium]|nr:MAG: hypothetical protein FD175_1170 [Beijerinckiaceae bacterium]